jgi:hypothetical protein
VLSLGLVAVVAPSTEALVLPQQSISGPAGSGSFGSRIQFLSNNNLVVIDPQFDAGAADVGAVHVYNSSGTLLNTITGSAANDVVGLGGIIELANGSFVIVSPNWSSNRGAVTLCPAAGCSGQVSAANSLVGSTANDGVGGSAFFGGMTQLPNSAYVVSSPNWDNGAVVDAGAVTYCPATGCVGALSAATSLVGSTLNDHVGNGFIEILAGGAYVVPSIDWSNGAVPSVGAVTWCPATGCFGPVSGANSLIGSAPTDRVGEGPFGFGTATALEGGGYVVGSVEWDNGPVVDAGAATWCPSTGCVGAVTAANSLVGSTLGDAVPGTVVELTGGTYVVATPSWDNGTADVGAVTRCPATGCVGPVTAGNSLIGSSAADNVGEGVVSLSAGRYVVGSPSWDNGAVVDAGAATYCPTTGCIGVVSATNSLVGSTAGDAVGPTGSFFFGSQLHELEGGAYTIATSGWDNGAVVDAGAVTWCPATGCIGPVTAANSLVGSTAGDNVGGFFGQTAVLSAGRYVVTSPSWANGPATGAGAVTWCPATGCFGVISPVNSLVGSATNDGVGETINQLFPSDNVVVGSSVWNGGIGAATFCAATGCTGTVAPANSLVGSTAGDNVGQEVTPLSGGRYAVTSSSWANGAAGGAGAVTVCPATGCVGTVSPANSLVGTTAQDGVGNVTELAGGALVVSTFGWDNGAVVNAGAVTWCAGTCVGPVSTANSLYGSTAGDQVGLQVRDLSNGDYLVITSGWDNGAVVNAGAVTYASGATGEFGAVTAANSVVGLVPNSGILPVAISDGETLLAVGFPLENRVVLGVLPSTDYSPLVPARLLDTRPAGPGIATIDGLFQSGGVVVGGTTLELQVGGRGGVAADAKAVALNVTVTEASDAGFVTVFPCGVAIPTASNLNFVAGGTVANAVITKVGTGGKVCLFANRTTHLIVDVNGVM